MIKPAWTRMLQRFHMLLSTKINRQRLDGCRKEAKIEGKFGITGSVEREIHTVQYAHQQSCSTIYIYRLQPHLGILDIVSAYLGSGHLQNRLAPQILSIAVSAPKPLPKTCRGQSKVRLLDKCIR